MRHLAILAVLALGCSARPMVPSDPPCPGACAILDAYGAAPNDCLRACARGKFRPTCVLHAERREDVLDCVR